MFNKRLSNKLFVGNIPIGGESKVVIQGMTDTSSEDADATTAQIIEMHKAGSEIVRITIDTEKSAAIFPVIKDKLSAKGYEHIPIVGDFHYNGHLLLKKYPETAKLLDKYRINPGNIGPSRSYDERFINIIKIAILNDKPIRIGVNWGSLDNSMLAYKMDENSQASHPKSNAEVLRDALTSSALMSAEFAVKNGFNPNNIVLSCKVSKVQELVHIYRILAKKSTYALHLGLTEAGLGLKAIVVSTAALSILLSEGIGDTIRVSITPNPGEDRKKEIIICKHILQSIGLRSFTPIVTSCPGCGRTSSEFYRRLAITVQEFLDSSMPKWKQIYKGVEELRVSVMGCIVNGPGESKHADIGISMPGNNEDPVCPVFTNGKHKLNLVGDNISSEFCKLIEEYISVTFSKI